MHPIQGVVTWFRNKRRMRMQRAEHKRNFGHADTVVPQLQAEVDERALQFGLDPELPELVALKQSLPTEYGQWGEKHCRHVVEMIDPGRDFSVSAENVIVIHERWLDWVLMPWTIAEHQFGGPAMLREQLRRIVVNKSGTHLFDEDGHELICYAAGVCDPERLADPGNRLRNAATIIGHHTGREFDWTTLVGVYSAVFELNDGDLVIIDLSTDSATA